MELVFGYVKQKQVSGDSQHHFTMSELCLIILIACHDKAVAVVGGRRTADVTLL